ncbi:MAG: PEP-CTERM sorting domain-containing protein [Planctomycetota bacterium]
MKTLTTPAFTTLAAGMLLGVSAQGAAITYVDALEGASGNTYATGGSLADTSWVGPNGAGDNETQWNKRTAGGTNGNVFQGRHNLDDAGGDQMPELTTEITGLADGLYDVWVFFWDADETSVPNRWSISAGLNSGALTSYSIVGLGDTSSPVLASTLTFDASAPLQSDGDLLLWGVNLGQATVAGGSTIDVFVDNLLGNTAFGGSSAPSSTNRTWYDGVGYALVPEPSSLALLGLGGLLALRRRR